VSPVRYELGLISPKTTFFIITAVKTSILTNSFMPERDTKGCLK
jgi:hypothetical protein